MGRVKHVWVLLVLTLLLPAAARAQATITGTVKDASGAILPGVDVEAAGPALLAPRNVQTDTNGIYRIVELPPGTYNVTFNLSGFTRVVREGIQVQGTTVVTIPIDMKVGAVAETITVTGETPVVDTQSVKQERVLKGETLENIPGTHAYGAILNAIPGLTVDNNGLANSPTMTFFTARGGNTNEGRMAINGMTVAAAFNGGGVSSLAYDSNNVEEVTVSVAGGLGESEIGGPAMNLIPKSGGNRFAGTMFWNYAGSWSSGNNIDDNLRSLQTPLSAPPTIFHSYDVNPSYGGPIKKDKVWFWGAYRKFDTSVAVPGVFANAYALDPAHYDYKQDTSVSSRNIQGRNIYTGRLTAQVTPKNRVMFSDEYQLRCEGSTLTVGGDGCRTRGTDWVALGSAGFAPQSPEANTGYFKLPYYVTQATWSAPVTSKILFEAGFTRFAYWTNNGPGQVPPDGTMSLIPVTELQAIDNHPGGFAYRGVGSYFYNWANPDNWRASVSYVTGAHSIKVGYQGSYAISDTEIVTNDPLLTYTFNNRAPSSFTFRLPNWRTSDRTETSSLYIQDSWTRNRLTLSGALRYDRAWSFSPGTGNGTTDTSRFNPAAITFPLTPGVSAYNDLTPRIGVAYDVFGTGKTALKFNFGHYLAPATNDSRYTLNNPAQTNKIVTSVTRTWADNVPNFNVDCNILNFAAQSGPGGDTCGQVTGNSVNFGKTGNTVAQVNPAILSGWGVRPNDYQWGLSLQQQVLPRVSVDVAYNRRWFHWREALGQGTVTDNVLVTPADYEHWTINAPVDSRLPGGGGYPITVYNLTAAGNAKGSQQYITVATDLGPGVERTDYWHGIDTTVNARMSNSLTMTLGTSTGRGITDSCAYQGSYDSPDLRNCRDQAPFQTTLRGSATYIVPKIDVLIAGTVRSLPGLLLSNTAGAFNGAVWNVPNTVVQSLLGHLPPGALATGTTAVGLLDTDHRMYAPRTTQVDMRFAKIVRYKRTRANIGIDLINLLNSNDPTSYTSTYSYTLPNGGSWYQPSAILQPRYARFSMTFDW